MVEGTYDGAPAQTSVVALLLNFMKEYHMKGEDEAIRAMLLDICADGSSPQELPPFGVLTSGDVRDAFAAFEVWKTEGRITMPCYYVSQTHDKNIDGIIVRRQPDGTLDLCNRLVDTELRDTIVKSKASPSLVEPRWLEGWFVPSTASIGQRKDMQHSIGVRQPMSTSKPAASAVSGGMVDITALLTGETWRLEVPADVRGLDLKLTTSSKTGIALADVTLLRFSDKTKVQDGDMIQTGREHRFYLAKSATWRVLYPFNGPDYGPDYLVLAQGDMIERVSEEGGWAQGRVVLRASGEAVLEAAAAVGWYPADYAEKL